MTGRRHPPCATVLDEVERHGHARPPVTLDHPPIGVIACCNEIHPRAPAVIAGLHGAACIRLVLIAGDRASLAAAHRTAVTR